MNNIFEIANILKIPTSISRPISKAVEDFLTLSIDRLIESQQVKKRISEYKGYVKKWSETVYFNEMPGEKNINNIYIPLDIFVVAKSLRMDHERNTKEKKLDDCLTEKNNILILGEPGAGKTTSMQYFIANKLNGLVFLIVVRDCQFGETDNEKRRCDFGIIFKRILNVLQLSDIEPIFVAMTENSKKKNKNKYMLSLKEKSITKICNILDKKYKYIIIDGVDEAPSEADRDKIRYEVNELSKKLTLTKIIITSRTGAINEAFATNITCYEICPLKQNQINDYINKFMNDKKNALNFKQEILKVPYKDLLTRPLTLAMLCSLYLRDNNTLPSNPNQIYKRTVDMFLEKWDKMRNITRKSSYAKFEVDQKVKFLSNFAFELTLKYGKAIFNTSELINIYKNICDVYELPECEAITVSKEIESHNGIIVQFTANTYTFSHHSIQEYLTANYILQIGDFCFTIEEYNKLHDILAIATCLSSNPSAYFCKCIIYLYNISTVGFNKEFLTRFVRRLFLEKVHLSYKNAHAINVLVNCLRIYNEFIIYNNEKYFEDKYFKQIENDFLEIIKNLDFDQLNIYYQKLNRGKYIILVKIKRDDIAGANYPIKLIARKSFFKTYK